MTADGLGQPPTVDLIIPVYNEAENILNLIARLHRLESELRGEFGCSVVFVDDHSKDASPRLLQVACTENPGYRYLRLARNQGSHVAILAGLEHSDADCAVFLAADLQDPPEIVPQMLRAWRSGAKVVWAVRERREGLPWFDRASARAFYWLIRGLSDVEFPAEGSDFALLDHVVVEALSASAGANLSVMTEIARVGFTQESIPYVKAERQLGSSKWTVRKKLKFAIDAVVSLSYRPLRAMSYAGLIFSALGFLYAAAIVALHLVKGSPVEGWASLMVVVLIVAGVQMLMIGILGEYLWRTLEEAKRRPRYVLEEAYGFDVPADKPQVHERPLLARGRREA